jgi:solute carrier family 13 (sodium-dependent dicarboxylate transporter), member 2/3/5
MIPMAVFAITRVITKDDLNKMSWDVLWLVAGGFALGLGIQKTGLAEHLLASIPFASWPALAILIGAALIAIFMSTFMSNTAATSLLAPIMAALGISMGAGLDSFGGMQGLLVAVALSCSLAMSLPISTPPNALAYSTGFVKTKDMAKMGVTVGLIGIIIICGMLLVLGGAGYFDNRKVAEVVPATTTEIVAAPVAAPAEVAPATAPAQ